MTTIRVMHEEQDVEIFDFGADVTRITLGRRPSNDVRLTDRSVSGAHARLEIDDGALFIEDLQSTNGTYLNGRPVQRARLQADDELLIGKVALNVRPAIAASAAAVAAPVEAVEPALPIDDDDDELDESMRAALALYSDDDDEPASAPAIVDEDDDIDFSEDARLFAQSAQAPAHDQAQGLADLSDASASFVDDDRLPDADSSFDESIDADGDAPLTVSERAKAVLGREAVRPRLHAVSSNGERIDAPNESARDSARATPAQPRGADRPAPHPLDGLDDEPVIPTHDLDSGRSRSRGAVIEIKNGAKSGQILPIDKPVTTLGRPGIQIAAIMRKPDGYFLMHIESDDSVERPTLNADSIGDEPVLLHSGDELNVAGIDVEFMLS